MPEQSAKRGRTLLLLAALFAVSTAVRFMLADYPAMLSNYVDEARYAMIAESIAAGRGVTIQYLPTTYQKLLYSLLLAPAYLLSDRVLTLRLVMLINAAVMSLGVFPAYWLARQITGRRRPALGFAAMYLLMPDMAYSMLVMSEALYIPLCLALLCLFWRLYDLPEQGAASVPRLFAAGLGLGFGCWTAYFCKEVALAFVVSYGGFVLYRLWACKKPGLRAAWLAQSGGYLAGFLLPHLLLKATLFAGMGNSYDQQSIGPLLQPGGPQFLVYSFFYYLGNVVLAFGIFPIVVPLLLRRQLPPKVRRFFVFCLGLAAVTAMVVAYTISLREDFGAQVPRTHLRYLTFLCVPLWTFMLPALRGAAPRTRRGALLGAGAGLCLLLPFYYGAKEGSDADQKLLFYMIDAFAAWPRWVILAAIAALAAAGLWLLLRHTKAFLPAALAVFLLLQGYNNYAAVRTTVPARRVEAAVLPEVRELRAFMLAHPQDTFLSAQLFALNRESRLMDTYCNTPNAAAVSLYELGSYQHREGMDLAGVPLFGIVNFTVAFPEVPAQYLIVPTARPYDVVLDDSGLELVAEYPHLQQALYRLPAAGRLPLVARWDNLIDGVYRDAVRDPHFASHYPSEDGTFVSGEGEDMLFFGPYLTVPGGTYTLRVGFDTSACPAEAGSVIGRVDLSSQAGGDLTGYAADITAGCGEVLLEGIVLPVGVPDLEIRAYAGAPGIRPLTVELTRTG